jgi:hypothetical protein
MARHGGDVTDAELKQRYIELIREGRGPHMAAREIGMTVTAMNTYLNADLAFKVAVDEARAELLESIEYANYTKAKAGDFNAIKLALESHLPDKWLKPNDPMVQLNIGKEDNVDISELHKKLEALRAREVERGPGPEKEA